MYRQTFSSPDGRSSKAFKIHVVIIRAFASLNERRNLYGILQNTDNNIISPDWHNRQGIKRWYWGKYSLGTDCTRRARLYLTLCYWPGSRAEPHWLVYQIALSASLTHELTLILTWAVFSLFTFRVPFDQSLSFPRNSSYLLTVE